MLEKYDEFALKRKSIQDKKNRLKKQMVNLDKEKLQVKKRQIQKSMNKFVNGPSGYKEIVLDDFIILFQVLL